jgi:beta-lactamase class A
VNPLLTILALLQPAPPPSLADRLLPLARAHKGKVAIAVKHLATGENYYLGADEPMPTASLIKLPVLIEAFLQAGEGKVRLGEGLTLRDADKVPGTGVLTDNLSDGATFLLRDALRLMTVYSDNTATNLVLDQIGIRPVNERMRAWGLKETRINAKVFRGSTTSVDPERTRRFGLGSTTAREMVTLLEVLLLSDRVRPASKQAILGMMRRCDDRDKFPRLLPPGVVVAHKTGTVSAARTDAGLIYLDDGPVALCVLTDGNADRRFHPDNAGNMLCARVARAVHDYFTQKGRAP